MKPQTTFANAIANLLFPAVHALKLDDGKLSEHRRLIALGSVRNTFKNTKAQLIAEVIKASKARGDEISEDEADLALHILCVVEYALQDDFDLKSPGADEDHDDFLDALATADRSENEFEEEDLREYFEQFGVESDVDIPDYIHRAIGSFAHIKGADYSYNYPDADLSLDDVMDPDQAALFAAMGMRDVTESIRASVAAGEDPLAQARAAAEQATGDTTTPTSSPTSSRPKVMVVVNAPRGVDVNVVINITED